MLKQLLKRLKALSDMYYLKDLSWTERYEPLGFYTLNSLSDHLEYMKKFGCYDKYIIKQDKKVYVIGMPYEPGRPCSGVWLVNYGVQYSG